MNHIPTMMKGRLMSPIPLDKAGDAASLVSAPVVYGVAGATILGITLKDWVLLGTAALLILNLILAGFKLCDLIRREKTNGDE